MRILIALVLCCIVSSANAQKAQTVRDRICALSEQEAQRSPQCIRWYFLCRPIEVSGGTTEDRALQRRAGVQVKLFQTEKNCEQFSYQEAYAAMQAALLGY